MESLTFQKHNIQITNKGKYTSDAVYVDDDGKNTTVIMCPEFDTMDEVIEWIRTNMDKE